MRLAPPTLIALLSLAPLAAVPAQGADDPLESGWRREPRRAAVRDRLGKPAIPARWRDAVAPGPGADRVTSLPSTPDGSSAILGPGDALTISQDDAFAASPVFGWEGRLAVREGAAGPADHLAFRFAVGQIARALPVNVTGLEVGFDNRYGRTSWPVIGLKSESLTTPLEPDGPWLAQVTGFTSPASALPAPTTAPGPDAFQRLTVPFATAVAIGSNPVVDDGMWSDAFDRAIDENLDNPASDWLECDLAQCGLNKNLTIRSRKVVKTLPGDSFGVKYPAASVLARRPITDLDAVLSVDYDVTASLAQTAGLFFRLESLDRFYIVEYRKGTNQVVLSAMTPGGLQPLAPPVTPSGTATTGNLRVAVSGVHPATSIQVWLGASSLLTVTDTTYGYGGVLCGIGSTGNSTGESWDNLVFRREPDLFALVQVPPGEDAALPAEWSSSSVGFGNVLASTDGGSFANVPAGASCVKAPNGFVQLRTAHDQNLFQVESKLVELALACPTCTDTRNLCAEDQSPADLTLPVFETGRTLELNAGWWNEHAPDVNFLRLAFELWQGGCSDPFATRVASQTVSVPLDRGQNTTAGAVWSRLAAPGLSFTPTAAGDYCAVAIELYDRNGDGCSDGWEGTPCPIGCTCVGDPDENAATGVLSRELKVVLPCTPLTVSELAPKSLRAVKDGVDPALTSLFWSTTGTQFRLYNIQMTADRAELAEPAIRDTAPTFVRVLGGVPDTTTSQALPAVAAGTQYFAVFQNDGCASGWSLQDP